jgi:hypothetical protein
MSTEQNNEFIIDNTTKEIPQNITYITFRYNFNQKVDNLSQNITYIRFGHLKNYIHNFWMHQPNGRLV